MQDARQNSEQSEKRGGQQTGKWSLRTLNSSLCLTPRSLIFCFVRTRSCFPEAASPIILSTLRAPQAMSRSAHRVRQESEGRTWTHASSSSVPTRRLIHSPLPMHEASVQSIVSHGCGRRDPVRAETVQQRSGERKAAQERKTTQDEEISVYEAR